MLNDLLLVQFLCLLTIFFIFWSSDVFSTIILGTIYLYLVSSKALLLGSDILISFLIIIDLGVFLVMFSFTLHLTKFLQVKNSFNLSNLNLNKLASNLISLSVLTYLVNFESTLNISELLSNTWIFFVSYVNYYLMKASFINSDLQILKEIYFYINNYEFFIISIAVYVGLISSYVVFRSSQKLITNLNISLSNSLNKFNTAESTYFFRYQNFTKQTNTVASSKVWLKKKTWF